MLTVSKLNSIKEFFLEKVTPGLKLQKADDNNVNNYELVSPQVHVGWIPPKGYLPDEMEAAIPCFIVGLDEAGDDSQDTELNIRISAVVFSPGLHEPQENEQIKFTPNFQGYHDLINMIDKAVAELCKSQIIKNNVSIQYPVKWGMYKEQQPYPYWYGWITFSVKSQTYPPARIAKDFL